MAVAAVPVLLVGAIGIAAIWAIKNMQEVLSKHEGPLFPSSTEFPDEEPCGVLGCSTVYNAESNEGDVEANFPEPGIPGKDEGYEPPKKPPKNGDKNGRVPNPNGTGKGWPDANGDVWVPTGGKGAHGGEHWDVQTPGRGGRRGKHRNVYLGGHVR